MSKQATSKFIPENAAVWFEIPVRDVTMAATFYEAVTGMPLKHDDSGPNPMAVFPAQTEGGVAGHLYPGEPAAKGGHTVHLPVPDALEDALSRVREQGGKVMSDPIAIPAGRFAYCQDPDGNSVGFFSPTK